MALKSLGMTAGVRPAADDVEAEVASAAELGRLREAKCHLRRAS